jgi:hypothetical protein
MTVGRQAYAHTATVRLTLGDDPAAIGASITVALCGHWEHDGPCPIAPHHTSWHHDPNAAAIIHTRTLYAVTPEERDDALLRIREGLATGKLVGPAGQTTTWRLLDDRQSPLEAHETEHAEQLAAS